MKSPFLFLIAKPFAALINFSAIPSALFIESYINWNGSPNICANSPPSTCILAAASTAFSGLKKASLNDFIDSAKLNLNDSALAANFVKPSTLLPKPDPVKALTTSVVVCNNFVWLILNLAASFLPFWATFSVVPKE